MNRPTPLPFDDLQPILLGVFGEVGSIMATAKKFHREGPAYASYRSSSKEEARVTFAKVVNSNIAKARGHYLKPEYSSMPKFDDEFFDEERLPDQFEVTIDSGQSQLPWNSVFIGDPLTDNIRTV